MHRKINSKTESVLVPNLIQKFAIIDQMIIWYGGINLLSFGKSDENIIRLDSESIASELIAIVDDLIKEKNIKLKNVVY